MMGPSPKCYISSFVEIGLLVPEKGFKGLTIYDGRGGNVRRVIKMPRTICSPYP